LLQGEAAADLDDVVGDNAKADPALHTFETSTADSDSIRGAASAR
jgi:hypothetical protein